ncbi:MAG: adenylate/guanylate cyclase domain-containing protein, partial [Cyanobacteria bacterium P01_H01_bin.153]
RLDAVNIASRMESQGLVNRIQVSDSTYQHVCDRYEFEDRGFINIKGRGRIHTYLLEGRKQPMTIIEAEATPHPAQ